jgi:hypothetical protein
VDIKLNAIDRPRGKYRESEKCVQPVGGELKEGDQIERKGEDRRLTYKRILNTEYGRK